MRSGENSKPGHCVRLKFTGPMTVINLFTTHSLCSRCSKECKVMKIMVFKISIRINVTVICICDWQTFNNWVYLLWFQFIYIESIERWNTRTCDSWTTIRQSNWDGELRSLLSFDEYCLRIGRRLFWMIFGRHVELYKVSIKR